MKMAKATERDIYAAGKALALLDTVSSGYYPAHEGEEDAPLMFDEDDPEHLRRLWDELKATLDAAPGWQGRVIGGMCYVILYPANGILDPEADTLELHPQWVKRDSTSGVQGNGSAAGLTDTAVEKLMEWPSGAMANAELFDMTYRVRQVADAAFKAGAAGRGEPVQEQTR